MASPKFPEPPPSQPPTSLEECDRRVAELVAKKDAWVRVGLPERIALLQACLRTCVDSGEAWVRDACRAKGIDFDAPRAGEEWLGGPMTTVRNVRLLIESLEHAGQPKPVSMRTRPDGQQVAQVFPGGVLDKLMFGGFTAEVWLEPGKAATQGKIYREKERGVINPGKVALVLGAGNVASIGPMDALYKLFAEDEVVILKTNPVNDYLAPHWERALKPLIDGGWLRIVTGGAEVGHHLCTHAQVDTIHITGSDRTHDIIVWGADPDEAARRREANEPYNTKPISSELGCVTPVFIVPGPWSQSDLEFQARHVAAMVANNASFNCNAAKVLVTSRNWPLRDTFLQLVRKALAGLPSRKAYYPGARQRYDGFLAHYPDAKPLTENTADALPWTVIPNVAPKAGEYALTNEAFCGVLAEVDLDAADAGDFLRKATKFANDDCWGTLSTMMLIHPKSQAEFRADFEQTIAELKYGGIGVNVWAGLIYGLVVTTWGAFPGHTLHDIRSGRGVVHNTYLFDNPQKSVVYAPFRIAPTPLWFADHKTQDRVGEKMTAFEANPSFFGLPGVLVHALRG